MEELDPEYIANQLAAAKERVAKRDKNDKLRSDARLEITQKYYYSFFPSKVIDEIKDLKRMKREISSKIRNMSIKRKDPEAPTSSDQMIILKKLDSQRLLINSIIDNLHAEYMTKEQLEEFELRIYETRGRKFQK